MSILFIYDDASPVPDTIRRIIGTGRFGDIVRRKRRLADTINAIADIVPECDYVRLADDAVLPELLDRIGKLPADAMVFRLPSSTVPLSTELFAAVIGKLPYALDPVFYGDPANADVPALLLRDDALAVLNERDSAERRKLFSNLERHAMQVGDRAQFVDISEISRFLAFMAGATEARHFNVTRMSAGVFRKWSADAKKMRGEYGYFHVADESMKRFLLPTFDYREEDGGASYAMEHLSVPDAAMQIVHHTFNPASFGRLMENFFAFVASRGRQDTGCDEARAVAERDIVDKLDRRMTQLLETEAGKTLDKLLAISGPHGDLASMIERCRALLTKGLAASKIDYLALGHGDPCFSNILYNAEINLFRLIDPRGAETREGAFMHPLYDLAKFSHSVIGGYDFVNGGLAECRLDGQMRLNLVLERGGPPAWMKDAFRKRLAELGWDIALVRAIEASLFLSMLPLHIDSPDKLPAFCLIAGDILAELEQTS